MKVFSAERTILENVGNNAFGRYSDRENALFVPVRTFGSIEEARVGTKTAFREFDDDGSVVEFAGLERFVSDSWNGVPLHLFDNHNHAFAFWCEGIGESVFRPGSTLVHVDMHSDLWPNPHAFDLSRISDAEYVERFTHEKTSVGNYVVPAMESGMFSRFVRIEGESDLLRELESVRSGEYGTAGGGTFDRSDIVLNLDLDFFAPDLDDVPFDLKREVVLEFARRAKFVTVATSPCFIDQDRAIRYLLKIFRENP